MLTSLGIQRILDRHYVAAANREERQFPIRGSAMGACPRRLSSLLAKRELIPLNAKTGRVFEDGTDRGKGLAKALAAQLAAGYVGEGNLKIGLEYGTWTTIPGIGDPPLVVRAACESFPPKEEDGGPSIRARDGKLQVRSRCDVVAVWANNRASLIEIKGKRSFGMKSLPNEGPGEEYLAQVGIQKRGLEEAGLEVSSVHWLFEDKDSQEWLVLNGADYDIDGPTDRALSNVASILNVYGRKGGFTGDEGTPVHAQGVIGKLPWQCRWCHVGPIVGQCSPGNAIFDKRRSGDLVPTWVVG